jgi:hypothetical protein
MNLLATVVTFENQDTGGLILTFACHCRGYFRELTGGQTQNSLPRRRIKSWARFGEGDLGDVPVQASKFPPSPAGAELNAATASVCLLSVQFGR